MTLDAKIVIGGYLSVAVDIALYEKRCGGIGGSVFAYEYLTTRADKIILGERGAESINDAYVTRKARQKVLDGSLKRNTVKNARIDGEAFVEYCGACEGIRLYGCYK